MGSVRTALLKREVSVGTWVQIGHPAVAEVLAGVGFDWIAVDCEHTDIDVAGFAAVARGTGRHGTPVLARVRENDTLAIRQILDAGADGVIVPLVSTAEEAGRAVAAAKYPPEGVRGFAFGRMNDWGRGFDDYVARANEEIAVVVMVETLAAVENINEILSVDGVDGVFLGPYDLSGSCGVPGRTDHPDVRAACERVVEACRAHEKAAGLHIVDPAPERIREALSAGFTFVAVGMDTVFLRQAAEAARGRAGAP